MRKEQKLRMEKKSGQGVWNEGKGKLLEPG